MQSSDGNDQMASSVNHLLEHFVAVRRRSVQICSPLEIEDYCPQPVVNVSPPKWHLGHTTWFFENFILNDYCSDYKVVEPQYFFIFNSYYETFGDRLNRENRGFLSRPTVNQVLEYRQQVDNRVCEFFSAFDENDKNFSRAAKLLEIGIHHEQQHQELLLMDIKYILSQNHLNTCYDNSVLSDSLDVTGNSRVPVTSDFIAMSGGLVEIGIDHGNTFAYDHETPKHKFYLNDYLLQDRCITNAEFLEFIADGGYCDFKLWLSDGWEWVQAESICSPLYWRKVDGGWQEYHLSGGWQELDPSLPVSHISHYEADAFASWAGARLPSEQEWEHAAGVHRMEPDEQNFYQEHHLRSRMGSNHFKDLRGGLWEWTSSAFTPYSGYRAPAGALAEYNAKFMSNQVVMRGGCYATPAEHYRDSYRNFFFPNQRWQFSGIRLAKDY